MTEQWRPVPEFDQYEVSDLGNLRRFAAGRWKPIKQRADKDGYLMMQPSQRGLRKQWRAARLVWTAFRGEIASGIQINHIDGVKTNNALTNLELVTVGGNQRHAYRIGLKNSKGERHAQARLSDDAVRNILVRLRGGDRVAQIARDFGVGRSTINDVRSGRTWRHVDATA